MKIASANLQLASSHASQQQHEVHESLKIWVGQRGNAGSPRPAQAHHGDIVTLSDTGKSAAARDKSEEDTLDGDPRLALIRSIMESLLGKSIKVIDAGDLQPDTEQTSPPPPAAATATAPTAPAGFGIEYDYHESYTEFEQTQFSASGTIKTADGKEISFSLELSMSRVYHEENNISLRLGDAARKTDPLVLNFSGTAAQLTDQRFAFDLNADGSDEQINFTAPGSGFLVIDRNRDGKINDGSELFGPTSGDGFQELARLDEDGNGWIDENDTAFTQLGIWQHDSSGQESVASLANAGVGAIALARVATPFDIKTADNALQGQIRSSGIFLQEDGRAGTIQHIDLTA